VKFRANLIVCAFTLLTAGPSPAQERIGENRWWSWPENPDSQLAEQGRKSFNHNCGPCHAPNATGTPRGANLIRSALVRHDIDGSAISAIISKGIPGKGMPPIQLAPEDTTAIVAFIQQTIQNYDRVSAGPPSRDYPVGKLLTGSAEAGKAFFNGSGGCSGCHSAAGDLAGIARKYPPVELQSRFVMPRTRKPVEATVTPPGGEPVTGELKSIDNYDIVLRDSAGASRTFAVRSVEVAIHDPLAAHRDLLPKYSDRTVHDLFAYLWTLQ
jgi:cytochrome c oxidase cbb3-type subunit III